MTKGPFTLLVSDELTLLTKRGKLEFPKDVFAVLCSFRFGLMVALWVNCSQPKVGGLFFEPLLCFQ